MTNKYENLDKALETNFLNEDSVDVEVVKKNKKIENKDTENNLNISNNLSPLPPGPPRGWGDLEIQIV
jgi:hypothetical protein